MKTKKIVALVMALAMALSIMPSVSATFFMGKVQAAPVIREEGIYYHGVNVVTSGGAKIFAVGYKSDRDDSGANAYDTRRSFGRMLDTLRNQSIGYHSTQLGDTNSMMMYFTFDGYSPNQTPPVYIGYIISKNGSNDTTNSDHTNDGGGTEHMFEYSRNGGFYFTFADKTRETLNGTLFNSLDVPASWAEHPNGVYTISIHEGTSVNTMPSAENKKDEVSFEIDKITLKNVKRTNVIVTTTTNGEAPFTRYSYTKKTDAEKSNTSIKDAEIFAFKGDPNFKLPTIAEVTAGTHVWVDKDNKIVDPTKAITVTGDMTYTLMTRSEAEALNRSSNSSSSSSSSSGGSSGGSNTKTTSKTDSSGAKITTTTTTYAGGSTTTTTKTAKDGTKTVDKKVVNKQTGTTTQTSTVTGTDGGQIVKKTETLKNGSVTETVVTKDPTGKQEATIYGTTADGQEGIITATLDKEGKQTTSVTYEASGKELTISQAKTTKTTMTIPDTIKAGGKTFKVTEIADDAFKGNKKMTKIEIGKNIKTIGANAFRGNTKLKTITLKGKVTDIDSGAFKGINKNAVIKIKASDTGFFKTMKAIVKAGAPATVQFKKI